MRFCSVGKVERPHPLPLSHGVGEGSIDSPFPTQWGWGQEDADRGTSSDYNLAARAPDFSNLTPLTPLSVYGEGGDAARHTHGSPSPFTERGLGGEVQQAEENATVAPEGEVAPCTLIRQGSGGKLLTLFLSSLLYFLAYAVEPAEALQQARSALERARRAQPAERKVFLQEAQRALASLPSEARAPLEQLITEAEQTNDVAAIADALTSVGAYQQTVQSPPSPAPSPQQVKAQLDAIFAEPDMQVPPKSFLERLSEAFQQALESFIRWLQRLFGGVGGARLGGLQPFLQWFVIVLLVLTIGLAASYLIGRLRLSRRAKPALLPLSEAFRDARALSALEWRELARRLAYEQNWQHATRAFYLGVLRLLHEAHLLDYDPALTNWEHLQRLRQPPLALFSPSPASLPDPALREEAYQLLRPLTLQFDSIWYGGAMPDEATYREFEQAFETLFRRLQPHAVPA